MSALDLKLETVTLERVGDHVLLATLDRPEVRNALNTQMGFDLRDLWVELYRDPADIRVVVLTGRGDKAFCAGGDPQGHGRTGQVDGAVSLWHAPLPQRQLDWLCGRS